MSHTVDRAISGFSLRHAWIKCLILLACIPLFPESIAPFLAIAAFFFAKSDAKRHTVACASAAQAR